jgi:hypothetical protein
MIEQEQWCRCPKCQQLIERTAGCNHITHLSCSAASNYSRTNHFCYCCSTELIPADYRREIITGTLHWDGSVYDNCRRAEEGQEARSKLIQYCRSVWKLMAVYISVVIVV